MPADPVVYTGRRKGGDKYTFALNAVGAVIKSGLNILTKRDWRGVANVPLQGPVIFVGNHYSHFDPLPLAHFLYNAGRHPHFLLKNSIIEVPVAGPLIKATGQIPVYRGSKSAAESLRAAIAMLESGGPVIIYPEGTTSKDPDRWPMRGKTGVARLALETGAPVVPIAQWGSQAIFDPLAKKGKFRFGLRKQVIVSAGKEVNLDAWRGRDDLSNSDLQDMSNHIMEAVRDELASIRGEEAPPPLYDRHRDRKSQVRDEESETGE
ncbi:lysophospholipid acyltransferase family protein [Haloglycomyces albus]|uniref:lysophospholipid acyltransferase family protein n=1 Tax=Haloglycomyces albus TaxID=526067 RepID=UPI00046D8198|nr:lysophospholipid acyltransferase family protein [Haloglycomyces albus]